MFLVLVLQFGARYYFERRGAKYPCPIAVKLYSGDYRKGIKIMSSYPVIQNPSKIVRS